MKRLLLSVLALVLAAAPAGAEDRTRRAAEHFAAAEAAEAREDWEAAITAYEQAYALRPHPSVLYNIARNYEHLGDSRRAADHYQRYLDESRNPPDRAAVERKIATLRALGRRAPPPAGEGRLVVESSVTGAEVWLDGENAGVTPLDVSVAPGRHAIAIRAEGHREERRAVEVRPGGTARVSATLTAEAPTTAGRWLIGMAYGVELTDVAGLYTLSFGTRITPWLDLEAFLSYAGYAGVGADGRVYLTDGSARVFLRTGASWGTTGDSQSAWGLESSIGLLWGRGLDGRRRGGVAGYVEFGPRLLFVSEGSGTDQPGGARVDLPLAIGGLIRY